MSLLKGIANFFDGDKALAADFARQLYGVVYPHGKDTQLNECIDLQRAKPVLEGLAREKSRYEMTHVEGQFIRLLQSNHHSQTHFYNLASQWREPFFKRPLCNNARLQDVQKLMEGVPPQTDILKDILSGIGGIAVTGILLLLS